MYAGDEVALRNDRLWRRSRRCYAGPCLGYELAMLWFLMHPGAAA